MNETNLTLVEKDHQTELNQETTAFWTYFDEYMDNGFDPPFEAMFARVAQRTSDRHKMELSLKLHVAALSFMQMCEVDSNKPLVITDDRDIHETIEKDTVHPERNIKEYYEQATPKQGFVYLGYDDYGYKIGFTKDITRREKQLRTGNYRFKIVVVRQADDIRALEHTLHNLFEAKDIDLEWYDLNEDDITLLIDKLGFMRLIEE
jgi:hypothetical protein